MKRRSAHRALLEKEAQLLSRGAYELGDEIRFETDYEYAIVQVDQAVKPARMYLPTCEFMFRLPLEGVNGPQEIALAASIAPAA